MTWIEKCNSYGHGSKCGRIRLGNYYRYNPNSYYSVAGSGDLLTEGYEAQRVTASVAGSGSIKCFATEFLKARTSGSGKIGYKGNPELDYPKKSLYKL